MKKRFLKVAVTTALTIAFAVPAFAATANPFSDVPAKHWAYDSVNKLAQAGLVDGYNDGTFKGDKTMTRYEMAQIVAKAMNKSLNADQQAAVDQLSKEFSTELNNLGVKVEGLQNKVDNMVKISGDARVRYGAIDNGVDHTDFRARVTFDGKIGDDMKFNARLSSGNIAYNDVNVDKVVLDTANVTFNALGLQNTIGRQDLKLGTGTIIDDKINGLSAQAGNFKMFAGNYSGKAYVDSAVKARLFGAEYKTSLFGANLTADFMKDETNDKEFYGANTSFGLAKNVTAKAEYVKENNSGDTAVAYGLKFDKLGLSATYKDVEANAYTGFSSMGADINNVVKPGNAFKGMEYQYDKGLNKNAVLTVKHQDFDNTAARTSAVVNVKF